MMNFPQYLTLPNPAPALSAPEPSGDNQMPVLLLISYFIEFQKRGPPFVHIAWMWAMHEEP